MPARNRNRAKRVISDTECRCDGGHSGDGLPTVVIRSKGKPGKVLIVALWFFGFMTLLGFARAVTGELGTAKDVQALIVVSVVFGVLCAIWVARRRK